MDEPIIKYWRLVFWDEYDFLEQDHVAATEEDIQDIAFRFYSFVARDAWGKSPIDNYFNYLLHVRVLLEEISPKQYLASL